MLPCISPESSQLILTWLLPPAAAVLSATALWVASRTRGTSKDALQTSSDLERLLSERLGLPVRNASRPTAPAPKKSSKRRTTST
jgi:hypothetical protein